MNQFVSCVRDNGSSVHLISFSIQRAHLQTEVEETIVINA